MCVCAEGIILMFVLKIKPVWPLTDCDLILSLLVIIWG